MMMAKLYGHFRTWLEGQRAGSVGAIPSELQPPEEVSRTQEHVQPPPIPSTELPQLESDVIVEEDTETDLRTWAEAFAGSTSGREV